MTASRDPDRLISAFLAEGLTELPDRVYDAVRSDIDRTRQRVVIGPWRTPDMNTLAKFAIAAAAVVVIAIVGINLLPKTGGDVGVTPTVSPSPSSTATPQPSPSPTSAVFPALGPLAIGRYPAMLEGVPLSFAIPASGWTSDLGSIQKGTYEQPDGASINFWESAPENVYADPCAHTPLSPAPSHTAASLAGVAATIPGTTLVRGPSSVSVGGRPAQHVVFTIREDIACDPHDFYLWYDESSGGASGGWRWAGGLGETHSVWIIDVDGKVVWIDGETFKGADAKPAQQIQQIIDSIKFT